MDRDWFERAELREGERLIRPACRDGLPKRAPKETVELSLDADVLAHFRAAGRGWQSRINAALRKVAGL